MSLITPHLYAYTMWQLGSAVAFALALSSVGTLVAPCPNGRYVPVRCHDRAMQHPVAEVRRLVGHRIKARMYLGAGGSSSGSAGDSSSITTHRQQFRV